MVGSLYELSISLGRHPGDRRLSRPSDSCTLSTHTRLRTFERSRYRVHMPVPALRLQLLSVEAEETAVILTRCGDASGDFALLHCPLPLRTTPHSSSRGSILFYIYVSRMNEGVSVNQFQVDVC